MNTLTQEQVQEVEKDIESAGAKIQEILKEHSLAIACQVGYVTTKFAKEEAPKVELKSE